MRRAWWALVFPVMFVGGVLSMAGAAVMDVANWLHDTLVLPTFPAPTPGQPQRDEGEQVPSTPVGGEKP